MNHPPLHLNTKLKRAHRTAKMVHLSSIPTDATINRAADETGTENVYPKLPANHSDSPIRKLEQAVAASKMSDDTIDSFATTVYGSRFAAQELPKHIMPEHEMPREIAYRMIKDDLSLDGNPMLNLASFVTTYMEDEAEKLMTEAFPKNFIDYEEYPQTAEIQNRCVSMIGRLFNAPVADDAECIGTSTVGSSEAVMLAVLAMKKKWKLQRQKEGKPTDKPNMVMSSAVQVVWEKAMRYFEIDEKYVYCTPERFVVDPKETVDLVDENTVSSLFLLGDSFFGS